MKSTLTVTISHDGHYSTFTGTGLDGHGPALVAAFRAWLETVPTLHEAEAIEGHTTRLEPVTRNAEGDAVSMVSLHGARSVKPMRQKDYRPRASSLLAEILALFADGHVRELPEILARFDRVTPSKVSEALGQGVRAGTLYEEKKHGVLRWAKR